MLVEWAKDKRPVWERICAKYGGKPEAFDWGTWQFFEWSLGKTWPTVASNAKARRFGWKRIDDTHDVWIDTFKTLATAGIIPSPAALAEAETTNGHKASAKAAGKAAKASSGSRARDSGVEFDTGTNGIAA